MDNMYIHCNPTSVKVQQTCEHSKGESNKGRGCPRWNGPADLNPKWVQTGGKRLQREKDKQKVVQACLRAKAVIQDKDKVPGTLDRV